jgi:sugar/nucleoside kinase (ribokinase family)
MAGLMIGLTRGADPQTVLETACRLGAIVASHDGATPLLPQELIQEFRASLKAGERSPSSRNA